MSLRHSEPSLEHSRGCRSYSWQQDNKIQDDPDSPHQVLDFEFKNTTAIFAWCTTEMAKVASAPRSMAGRERSRTFDRHSTDAAYQEATISIFGLGKESCAARLRAGTKDYVISRLWLHWSILTVNERKSKVSGLR